MDLQSAARAHALIQLDMFARVVPWDEVRIIDWLPDGSAKFFDKDFRPVQPEGSIDPLTERAMIHAQLGPLDEDITEAPRLDR